MNSPIVAVIVVGLLLAAATPAFGQSDDSADTERARFLYEYGVELYDEGQYLDAIRAWEEGFELSERSAFLYNMANAYERMGDLEPAIELLETYRETAEPDELDALDLRIETMRSRLNVEPEVVYVQIPEPAVSGLEWTLIGTTVAGLGTGITFGVLALNDASSFDSACTNNVCTTEARDYAQRRDIHAVVSDFGWIIAGASAVGLVLSLVLDRPADDTDPVTVGATPLPGGFAGSVELRF